MKKLILLIVIGGIFISSCRKIEVDGESTTKPGGDNETEVILEGKITADMKLTADKKYILRKNVLITNGATLTVEPGTMIYGETSSKGYLVVTRGAKINAEGTADKPIVFTSQADQFNQAKSGDWGGIVILGKAAANSSFNGQAGVGEIEGGVNDGEGNGLYGGGATPDNNDNSGVLKYVRIEYAGYAFLPDKELNSLTLGAVGKGTKIEYVQVSYALDDAIECFGGNVDLKHIVINKTLDDDLDTDNGYSGKVQFVIIQRDSARADISKSESFESDNDANGSVLTPQTSAVYSNITVLGPRATAANVGNSLFLAGAQIRRNSGISIFNSVFVGWPKGLLIDDSKGTATSANVVADKIAVKNVTLAGCEKPLDYSKGGTDWGLAAVTAWFNTAACKNAILIAQADVKLKDPFNYKAPDFTPEADSPLAAAGAADFVDTKLIGFEQVNFRGAVAASGTEANWWKGWTSFK
jgi:hypothetical protein